jgi:dimethylhistidine N-methyltransferase
MNTAPSPQSPAKLDERVASAVLDGLSYHPRRLPSWLFYDEAGSQLFDAITELPEYYLTRTERSIFAAHGAEIIAQAAGDTRLRIAELGAGSADKTRLLLAAAVQRQESVVYEPVDVSASALAAAQTRIEREIAGVHVSPQVLDYTRSFQLEPMPEGERRLVLYIGSSIGNFTPREAERLLRRIRAGLRTGDSLLLGVDLVKDEATLLAAYNDAAGTTAAFNRNLLVRLNRELDADFAPESFAHRVLWNAAESRIEMHLESHARQTVHLAALNFEVQFTPGERIHTENSYKYRPGKAERMLAEAGFAAAATWTDARGWFAVCLGRAG